jgi:hypothetical protein
MHKPAQSALFLAQDTLHTRRLSMGCPYLDSCLCGGIDTHGVTEIAGAAGAGKTQMALHCMLQAQLPPSRGGLGGGAVFLHADTPSYVAPMRRLEELAAAFADKHADLGATTDRLMSHIHVMQLNSAEALSSVLHDTSWLQTKQVPSDLSRHPALQWVRAEALPAADARATGSDSRFSFCITGEADRPGFNRRPVPLARGRDRRLSRQHRRRTIAPADARGSNVAEGV